MRRATRRIARWAGRVLGAMLALAVVIHVPPVRRWLAAHGHHGAGVCPLGYGATPRVARTTSLADVHSIFGFGLGKTTRADITAWADRNGVTCRDRHHRTLVECTDVPAVALGQDRALPATGLWLALDGGDTLASIQVARRAAEAAVVADEFAAAGNQLTTTLGSPTTRDGQADAATLASGALRQASLEFHAPGYRAQLRETNMGDGYLLTENYARVD
jgi:hypothetical protein